MNYWKEHYNENATKFSSSLMKQVDMTYNGKEVDDAQIDLRVKAINQNLLLAKDDVLLDICCGNGLVTDKLAGTVNRIYGVDFSEGLITVANGKNQHASVSYEVGDITKINLSKYSSINKVNVYSGLQCISLDELRMFLEQIAAYKKPLLVYCANVPDKEKLWNYYDNDEKKAFYLQREAQGKPHMGTWFNKGDITRMTESLGLDCRFLDIDKGLNTNYYRFDVLLNNNILLN